MDPKWYHVCWPRLTAKRVEPVVSISWASCYRAANAIFGKVGRIASEEVILQLIISKCIPVLLYRLEACPTVKSELSSLDFVINRFLMKMFNTNDMHIVRNCQMYFNFDIPSTLWAKRVRTFNVKFSASNNMFCKATGCLAKLTWFCDA